MTVTAEGGGLPSREARTKPSAASPTIRSPTGTWSAPASAIRATCPWKSWSTAKPPARQTIAADGKLHELKFEVPVKESSWIAARVLPAAHTNPVFAMVGGKPIRASRASAEWCLNAVNQCWTQKAPRMRAERTGRGEAGIRSRARGLPPVDPGKRTLRF